MNRLGAIFYGLAVLVILLLFARESIEPSIYLFQEREARNVALGVSGLLISTFAPLILSLSIWIKISALKMRWFVHLIFIPAAIVIFKVGSSMFFYGADVSGDNSPEGYSLFVAGAFLFMTLVVHTTALIRESYKNIKF